MTTNRNPTETEKARIVRDLELVRDRARADHAAATWRLHNATVAYEKAIEQLFDAAYHAETVRLAVGR